MDYRQFYKENPFSNKENKTQKIKKQFISARHSKRLDNFNNNRSVVIKEEVKKVKNRQDLLQQWKEKKIEEKKRLQAKTKRPFVVGITHHSVGSPFRDCSDKSFGKKLLVKKAGPVKHFPFASPAVSKFNFKCQPSSKILTVPMSPKFSGLKKNHVQQIEKPVPRKIFMENNQRKLRPRNCQTVPKKVVVVKAQKVLLNNEDFVSGIIPAETNDLISCPATDIGDNDVPASSSPKEKTDSTSNCVETTPTNSKPNKFVISPFVCLSRGKDRSRIISQPEDSAEKKVMRRRSKQSLIVAQLQEEKTLDAGEGAPYYFKLDEESNRIKNLCDVWSALSMSCPSLPTDVKDEIDSVVGQSRLLVKDKFQQFKSLIDRFVFQIEDPPVTVNDLDGFWDMMYLQVDNLNDKFNNLELLKENNWKRIEVSNDIKPIFPKKPKKIVTKPKSNKPQTKVNRGNFRQFLKGMKNNKNSEELGDNLPSQNLANDENLPSRKSLGESNLNSNTPRKSLPGESLLKIVMSASIHEKSNSSTRAGLNSIRASLTGKIVGSPPVIIVNDLPLIQSPLNKSILKKSPHKRFNIVKKPKKKVLFGEKSLITFNDCDNDFDLLNSTFTLEDDSTLEKSSSDDVPVTTSESTAYSMVSSNIENTACSMVSSDIENTACSMVSSDIENTACSMVSSEIENSPVPVTPKRSAKKKRYCTPDNFTPRRSMRLSKKLATTPEPCETSVSKSKTKGNVTPYPSKRSSSEERY